jgi:hypothetical protein
MRLFDATSTYVYIFCAYALNALVFLLHSRKGLLSSHQPQPLYFRGRNGRMRQIVVRCP